MKTRPKWKLALGVFGLTAAVLAAAPASAGLRIEENTNLGPGIPTTDDWDVEPGQSIPTNRGGFVNGRLIAVHAGWYRFTYGPPPPGGLPSPPATGHGSSTFVNEFRVGGDSFCTQANTPGCGGFGSTPSQVGDTFTQFFAANTAIAFEFFYHQGVGNHLLTNGSTSISNGAYLVQIGEGTAPNAGIGRVAYLGLSDGDPYPNGDHDFQDLTLSITQVQVPEPMSLALFGLGLAGLGAVRRRTRRA